MKEVEGKNDVLFNDMLDSYVSYVSEKLSEPTISAYRHKIIQFAIYMYDINDESELYDKIFENFDFEIEGIEDLLSGYPACEYQERVIEQYLDTV